MSDKIKLAILQPRVPHYREDFFNGLKQNFEIDIFVYQDSSEIDDQCMHKAAVEVTKLRSFSLNPVLIYDIFPLLKGKYDVLILMGAVKHTSTWALLLIKRVINIKIVLWGHGISINRYVKFQKKMPFIHRLMYKLSDGAWFYTKKEMNLWKNILPNLCSTSLGNTISGVERILELDLKDRKQEFKLKHQITQNVVFIFCARFNNEHRRVDLLLKVMERLDKNKFGLIVIGEGPSKPDFSNYYNIYDFGQVYDDKLKDELFTIADIYFQPGWLGLSVVEAMAYGIPVITFKRGESIFQCVEYDYVTDGENGRIFETVDQVYNFVNKTDLEEIFFLGQNSHKFVSKNLRMTNMITNATKHIIKTTS